MTIPGNYNPGNFLESTPTNFATGNLSGNVVIAMAYANAAEHLRHASIIAMRRRDDEPFKTFAYTVPKAARDMPLHLLPTPVPIASATGVDASATMRAMLRMMADREARESDYTLAWFCAASLLGEECCALAEAGVHTLAQLRTFHESNGTVRCLSSDSQKRLCELGELVSRMFKLYEAAEAA